MELAEAERAAVEGGQRIAEAGVGVANVEEPRDPVAECSSASSKPSKAGRGNVAVS